MRRLLVGILLLWMFGTICTSAKRVPPKDIPPVVVNGTRYSANGDGKDSYVVATDVPSGNELWRVKVFHTRIEFWRGEEDNQWVFISDLKFAGNSLLVRDEKNRCYSIDMNTKHVKNAHCGSVFPPQEPRR
jgi:outer membrane protein assembly factor BamB